MIKKYRYKIVKDNTGYFSIYFRKWYGWKDLHNRGFDLEDAYKNIDRHYDKATEKPLIRYVEKP